MAVIDEAGVAHFRGRMDRQIKLRGYRVELQEVEAHLRAVCSTRGPRPRLVGRGEPALHGFWADAEVAGRGPSSIEHGSRRRGDQLVVAMRVEFRDPEPVDPDDAIVTASPKSGDFAVNSSRC